MYASTSSFGTSLPTGLLIEKVKQEANSYGMCAPNLSRPLESAGLFDQFQSSRLEPDFKGQAILNKYHTMIKTFYGGLEVGGVDVRTCDKINKVMVDLLDYTEIFLKQNFRADEDKHIVESVISKMKRPLKEVSSSHLRTKWLHSSEFYIEPQIVGISLDSDMKRKFSSSMLQSETCDFVYIPITKTLQILFKNSKFREAYLSGQNHVCSRGVYQGACCGNYYREGKISLLSGSELPPALAQVYSDAAVVNEGKKKDVSLTFFYVSFRNLPDCFLSQEKHIHLVAICKSSDISNEIRGKGKDYNKIQRLITDDLQKLEKGIVVRYTEEDKQVTKTLRGSLFVAVNDNKGHQEFYGLVESPNATFFCRFDYMTRADSKSCTDVEVVRQLLRPSDGEQFYKPYVDAKKKNDYVSTKGVALDSVLKELRFYSFVDTFTVDPFHDFPEGIMPLVLRKFFNFMIDKKILSFEAINSRILGYDYGSIDSCYRPSSLNLDNDSLGQGGVQMINMFNRVPFMFDDLIAYVKPFLELISQFVLIHQISSSTYLTENDLLKLENLIKEALENSKRVLRQYDTKSKTVIEFNLTPKLHYLLHYCFVIRNVGPVHFTSTIKYERKHSFFKKLARKIPNQEQLLYYLAKKHQEWLAMKWCNEVDLIEIDHSKEYDIDEDIRVDGALEDGSWSRVHFIEYFHKFSPGRFISVKQNSRTEFLKITDIYINKTDTEKKYFLRCTSVKSIYQPFYNAYEVSELLGDNQLIEIEKLSNLETFSICRSRKSGKDFIFCKKNCLAL